MIAAIILLGFTPFLCLVTIIVGIVTLIVSKKGLKICLAVLGFIGLITILICVGFLVIFAINYFQRPVENQYGDMGWFGLLIVLFNSILGVITTLISGLITRPRYFWQPLVFIGIIFIVLWIIMFWIGEAKEPVEHSFEYFGTWVLQILLFASPGIVLIIEGIIIRWLRNRKIKNTQEPDIIVRTQ
jgi:hypothetical protein